MFAIFGAVMVIVGIVAAHIAEGFWEIITGFSLQLFGWVFILEIMAR